MKTFENKLTSKEFKVLKILRHQANGRENAISQKKLLETYNGLSNEFEQVANTRTLRLMIKRIRTLKNGFRMIGSCNKGYYYAKKGEDANDRLRKNVYSAIETLLENSNMKEYEDLIKYVASKKKTLDKPTQGQKRLVFNHENDEVDYFAREC